MKSPSINQQKNIINNFIGNQSTLEKITKFNKNIATIINNIKETNGKIAIVSDFDFTLTKKYEMNNDKINYYSTYSVLENASNISEDYRRKFKVLFEKYNKYECDTSIDFNIRESFVFEWYKDILELIMTEDLNRNHFEEMVDQSENKFYFRNGILELFENIMKYKITFYIISAGLHEIIEDSLRKIIPFYDLLLEYKLIIIIANKFIYEETTNKMIGYFKPIIYTFNKGEV